MLRMRPYVAYLSLLPALSVLAVVALYPTARVVLLSLSHYELTKPGDSAFVGLANYAALVADDRYLSALLRTLYFTALSVLGTVVVGYLVALLLNTQSLRGAEWFRTLLLIPMLVSSLVAGAAFRYLFDHEYGLINYVLQRILGSKVPFLGDPDWALHAVILVEVWQWWPFATVVFYAGLQRLPADVLEAARLDGANWWYMLRYMQLPLLRDVISVVLLIRMMDALREFDKVYILTAGGPGTASETLSLYLWREAFQYFDLGYSSAMALSLIVVTTLLANAFLKVSKSLAK